MSKQVKSVESSHGKTPGALADRAANAGRTTPKEPIAPAKGSNQPSLSKPEMDRLRTLPPKLDAAIRLWLEDGSDGSLNLARDVRNRVINDLLACVGRPEDTRESLSKNLDLALSFLGDLQPRNALEALLTTQMIATHLKAMHFLRTLAPETSIRAHQAVIEMATKLQRTLLAQYEALHRLRGKGRQRVTVEHVTVNRGGKAIVGTISHRPKRRARRPVL
jgi:hypothetical protein